MISVKEKMLNIADRMVKKIDHKKLLLYGATYVRITLINSLIWMLVCFYRCKSCV